MNYSKTSVGNYWSWVINDSVDLISFQAETCSHHTWSITTWYIGSLWLASTSECISHVVQGAFEEGFPLRVVFNATNHHPSTLCQPIPVPWSNSNKAAQSTLQPFSVQLGFMSFRFSQGVYGLAIKVFVPGWDMSHISFTFFKLFSYNDLLDKGWGGFVTVAVQ